MKSRLTIAVIIIFLIGPLLELATRLFMPQPNLAYNAFHPLGFPIIAPNLDTEVAVLPVPVRMENTVINPYKVPVRTNSFGQRNPIDFAWDPPKDKMRILSLGGSMAFGWPFSAEYSYPNQIQKKMPHTEVINAAVIGTSPSHIWEYYLKLGQKFHPHTVLVQLRPSSMLIDDLIQDALGPDALEIEWLRANGYESWVNENLTTDFAGAPAIPLDSLPNRDEIYKSINATMRGGHPIRQFLYDNFHFFRLLRSRGIWFSSVMFFKSYLPHQSKIRQLTADNRQEFANRSFKFTEAYLRAIKKLTDKNKSRLILIVMPNKFGCAKEVLAPWQKLLSILKQSHFEIVSAIEKFCNVQSSTYNPDAFLVDETHPTQAMYEYIANEVVQLLKTSPSL